MRTSVWLIVAKRKKTKYNLLWFTDADARSSCAILCFASECAARNESLQ